MTAKEVLLAALVFGVGCAGHTDARAEELASAVVTGEETKVYEAFLNSWRGKDQKFLNVAANPKPVTEQDLEEFASCAGKQSKWVSLTTSTPLAGQLSKLSWVHLVDPATWRTNDPEDLIAKGMPVNKAVDRGFSKALLTLSTVAFDASGHFAALNYSLVCGRLCGNGGAVLFERKGEGWVRSKKQCGMWMSLEGKPNSSFATDGFASA